MSEKITFHTWDEAIEHSENQPEMLVETLLPAAGVALLAGEPGIGKSFFALNLAHSIGPVSYTHLTLPTTPYV